MVSPEQIRALDGPALTRLAYQLGLAPEGSMDGWPGPEDIYANRDIWEPYRNIEEADVVFRALRPREWDLFQGYDASQQFGWVTAFKARASQTWECQWRMRDASDEPLALLRCAVLAVASEKETPHAVS